MGNDRELSKEFILLFPYQITTRYFTTSTSATTSVANSKNNSKNYVCRYEVNTWKYTYLNSRLERFFKCMILAVFSFFF